MKPINKIHIHNLRGIKNLEISLTDNLLILGENGTGKSSIIDTLELFFTKEIERIKGRQDVPVKDAIPFSGSEPTDRWVDLTLSETSEAVRLIYGTSPIRGSTPPNFSAFFEMAANRPFILHRYQLMGFIEARAAERYKRLSSLIGMERLDKIVDAWRQVLTKMEKDVKIADGENQSAWKELQIWLKKDVELNIEVCNAVNQAIAPLGLASISKRADITERQQELKGRAVRPINFARAEVLRTVLTRIEEMLSSFTFLTENYHTLFSSWQNFIEQSSHTVDARYEQILIDGRRVIDEFSLDVCPLCEQDIVDKNLLIGRIDTRLDGLHALIHARQKMDEERAKTQKAIFSVQEIIGRLRDSLAAGALQDINGLRTYPKNN